MGQGAHPLADAELLEVFVSGVAHLDVDVEHEEALQARGCMQAGLTGLAGWMHGVEWWVHRGAGW